MPFQRSLELRCINRLYYTHLPPSLRAAKYKKSKESRSKEDKHDFREKAPYLSTMHRRNNGHVDGARNLCVSPVGREGNCFHGLTNVLGVNHKTRHASRVTLLGTARGVRSPGVESNVPMFGALKNEGKRGWIADAIEGRAHQALPFIRI